MAKETEATCLSAAIARDNPHQVVSATGRQMGCVSRLRRHLHAVPGVTLSLLRGAEKGSGAGKESDLD